MYQVSPEPGENLVSPAGPAEMRAAGALGKLLCTAGGQEFAELGVHCAFLSIACNVI
jgi:hypothetical protein